MKNILKMTAVAFAVVSALSGCAVTEMFKTGGKADYNYYKTITHPDGTIEETEIEIVNTKNIKSLDGSVEIISADGSQIKIDLKETESNATDLAAIQANSLSKLIDKVPGIE